MDNYPFTYEKCVSWYQVKRKPTSKCSVCLKIWRATEAARKWLKSM